MKLFGVVYLIIFVLVGGLYGQSKQQPATKEQLRCANRAQEEARNRFIECYNDSRTVSQKDQCAWDYVEKANDIGNLHAEAAIACTLEGPTGSVKAWPAYIDESKR